MAMPPPRPIWAKPVLFAPDTYIPLEKLGEGIRKAIFGRVFEGKRAEMPCLVKRSTPSAKEGFTKV